MSVINYTHNEQLLSDEIQDFRIEINQLRKESILNKRETFAAYAMQRLIAHVFGPKKENDVPVLEAVVKRSYEYADAMLEVKS